MPPPAPPGSSLLAAVRQRHLVRVGYVEGQAPYSFFNSRGELVGFDVEMAHQLANDLDMPWMVSVWSDGSISGTPEWWRSKWSDEGVMMP